MKVYDTQHIRNVALVGHQGSGKTTLAEAMLYVSGAINRMGSIEEGNTVSDYHPSEIERQMSVFTSMLHTEWDGHKINILDTPGYLDFVAEVLAALRVADTALFVINATEGVAVGTERAWRFAEREGKPSMFVLNHLDHAETNFEQLVEQIRNHFGRGATVVQLPAGQGTRAIIDVLLMKQLRFPAGGKEMIVEDIDPAFRERAEQLHQELVENIAENDEELMELYFEQGELSEDQMRKGLREAMIRRQLFPIFLTSAKENIGISRLMGFIDNVCPSPADMPSPPLEAGDELKADPEGPEVLFVYRTMAEQHVGEYSFFRAYSGTLEQGMDLENAQTGSTERIGQIYTINGKQRESLPKMMAGDLGAVVKLKNTHTNNTLRRKGTPYVVAPIEFPEPIYWVAVKPLHQGEEDKLASGLHQLREEDPSLVVKHDPLLKQILLGGQGELHLQIARYRLKHRFGVEVAFERPRVSYRETITNRAAATYRHKKQTGGAGQFAEIAMMVEPLKGEFNPPPEITVRNVTELETPWGAKIEFIDAIVGGVIDMRRFAGAIQKGILEAMQEGPVAGYPVGDIRVVIYNGKMHPVDSNEAAFKTAAKMVFREAFRQANPVLLEPIHEVEILVPEAYMGDVLGDLNTRRAQILGMEVEGGFQKIKALVPEAELHQYATTLRSLTQGRGLFSYRFSHYAVMPRHVQEKVVAETAEMAE